MEIIALIAIITYALVYLPIWWVNHFSSKQEVVAWDGIEKITLLIPFYNEYENLPKVIRSIQELVVQPTEVIFIDDHSTDRGPEILLDLIKSLPHVKYLKNTNERGKKNALTIGVETALHNIIVTTDADCVFHPLWLSRLVGNHISNQNIFTFGLVEYTHSGHWLGLYEWMESRALMSTGLGMFRLGRPIMCNGANLVFNRDSWYQVGGYEGKMKTKGGDDVFLMHSLWKRDRDRIGYCVEEEAVVYTLPQQNFRRFMKQRKRWAAKTGKYDLTVANLFPFVIAGINLFVLISFILLLAKGSIGMAIGMLITKAILDYLVILSLKQGFRSCVSFPMILQYQLFQLTYPFFLPFFSTDWKR